jgi:hypothetical protein
MRIVLAGIVCLGLTGSAARGALLAADSYKIGPDPTVGEYVAGNAAVQPANLTNLGFSNGGYTGGTTTSNFAIVAGGLDAPGVGFEAGDTLRYVGTGRDGISRRRARNTPGLASSATYYLSHLVSRDSIATENAGYALTGFGNTISPDLTSTGTLAGVFVGFAGSSTLGNFGNLVLRSRNTTSTTINADTILVESTAANTTYHVVIRLDVNVAGGQDQVTYWVNPSDVTSEATMTASSVATGTYSSFALQGSTDFVRLNGAATNWDANVHFDEPRLGTDLASVVGPPVPEPAGLACLALCAMACTRRGPRRR